MKNYKKIIVLSIIAVVAIIIAIFGYNAYKKNQINEGIIAIQNALSENDIDGKVEYDGKEKTVSIYMDMSDLSLVVAMAKDGDYVAYSEWEDLCNTCIDANNTTLKAFQKKCGKDQHVMLILRDKDTNNLVIFKSKDGKVLYDIAGGVGM